MPTTHRIWVVIPAAGVGRRMSAALPKQYLPLAGRTVIEWSLSPFLANDSVSGIVVGHAPGDERVGSLLANTAARMFVGGEERADTVLRGLNALAANDLDWVLVHDAARPCLHFDDLSRLIAELSGDDVGGLLACPVSDTLKSADEQGQVAATVPRDRLWRALTPQMFRYGLLRRALLRAREQGNTVTDESSAVEALGFHPKLVAGRSDNIKITLPEDLAHAEHILCARRAIT
jgi:2-C-methyl-D-erythritol 4-phosphate cytidylyltransferase